jgi:hypothetical protein
MKIYLRGENGRIVKRTISSKNMDKYQIAERGAKYKMYNKGNLKRSHKPAFGKHNINVYERIYEIRKLSKELKEKPGLKELKEKMLNEFREWAKENPKIQKRIMRALEQANINDEGDGWYQLNNIKTPIKNTRAGKFKLRTDGKQFKLIIDDGKYNYDLLDR